MNREAFRDDLAAQRVAIFGYDPAAPGSTSSVMTVFGADGLRYQRVTTHDGAVSYCPEPAEPRQHDLANWNTSFGAEPSAAMQSLIDAVARQTEDSINGMVEMYRSTNPEPLTPNRLRDLMTYGWVAPDGAATHFRDPYLNCRCAPIEVDAEIQASDRPGIAAMAAKSVKPTPEPVVSLRGEPVFADELAEALEIIRAKRAPTVKETPRGLMCMPETFDHRLGAWRG